LHSGDVWPEAERNLWLELSEGLIYKDKDEAANRGGLPTLRALAFFEATLKSAVASPEVPSCTGTPNKPPNEFWAAVC